MRDGFVRDRLTWAAYVVLGWFAYLQATPGLVVPHLRRELDLTYSTGGLYVTAFAAGSTVAGLLSGKLERVLGRRLLLWSSAALMGVGTVGLTAGGSAVATIGSVLGMGLGGGLVLATVQAGLADHHVEHRTVALAELNVAASCGYLLLVGVLSLMAQMGAGWRAALLVSLVVPVIAWWSSRGLWTDAAPTRRPSGTQRLPGAFWITAAILVCTTAVEWTVTAWGATLVQETTHVSADIAVTMMAGYFGGILAGRVLGSRLAFRHDPARLLAAALLVTAIGFGCVWAARSPVLAVPGLVVLGAGIGNLFPMSVSAALSIARDQAGQASGRVVAVSAGAVLLAPPTVGALADATSLEAALGVVPALLALAAVGLAVLWRATRGEPADRAAPAGAVHPGAASSERESEHRGSP
jgi:MFS family permease